MTPGQKRSIDNDYRLSKVVVALLVLIPIGAIAVMIAVYAVVRTLLEWRIR